MNYLLDTNILLLYIRGGADVRKLEEKLDLLASQNRLLTSVISVGELKSIAMRNKWGKLRLEQVEGVIRDFLVLDINTEEIVNRYAEIDTFSQGKHQRLALVGSARNMGKNDLWIAATASVYDLTLLTTDSDFSHLKDNFLKLQIITLL